MATRADALTVRATLLPSGQPELQASALGRAADLTISPGGDVFPAATQFVLTLKDNGHAACEVGSSDDDVFFAEYPVVTDGENVAVTGSTAVSEDCSRWNVTDQITFSLERPTDTITISAVQYNVGAGVSAGPISVSLDGSCTDEGCGTSQFDALAVTCGAFRCSNATVAGRAELQPTPPIATAIDDHNVRFDVTTYNVGDGGSPFTTVDLTAPWDETPAPGVLAALAPGGDGTTSFTLAVPDDARGSTGTFTVAVDGNAHDFDVVIPEIDDGGGTGPTTSTSTTVTSGGGGGRGGVVGPKATTTTTLTLKEKVVRAKKAVKEAKAVALKAARAAAHRRQHALPAWIRPTSDPSRVLVAVLVLALATVLVWRFVLNPARHAHDHKRPPRLDPRLTVNWSGHRRVSFLPTPHPAVIGVAFDLSKRTIAWKKGSP